MFKQGFAGLIFTVIIGVALVVGGYLIFNPSQVVEAPDVDIKTPTESGRSITPKPVVNNPVIVPAPKLEPDLPIELPKPEPTPPADPEPTLGPDLQTIELGNEFTLGLGQIATVFQTGLKIKVLGFINNPCPESVECIWSGQGVELEYRSGNETKAGLNLTEAYGHKITIRKTNYETYATLVVEKK